jgi:hypothetical protein
VADFTIKKDDLLPVIQATVTDADDAVVDLTGGTVKFLMMDAAGVLKINTTGGFVTDGSDGQVKYEWASDDTDTAGDYRAEFEITMSGKPVTAPNDDYLTIKILDDLG